MIHPAALPVAVVAGILFSGCATAPPTPAIMDRAVGEVPGTALPAVEAGPHAVETPPDAALLDALPPVAETGEPVAESSPWQGPRGGWHRNFNVLLGMRFLDEDIWRPLEDQPLLGFEFDMRPRRSPFGFELGFASAYAWDSVGVVDLDTWTFELYGGARATFGNENGKVFPYVGGGLSWFYTEFETLFPVFVRDNDNSFAGYAHAGIYFKAGSGTNVGIDARTLFGSELNLFGADADGDYWQIALILGGGF